MAKTFIVYMMASRKNGTIYIGVTSRPLARIRGHREGVADGFTKRYGVKKIVWYEVHGDAASAIRREKQLKEWHRAWKIGLIEGSNPAWRDLWFEITEAW